MATDKQTDEPLTEEVKCLVCGKSFSVSVNEKYSGWTWYGYSSLPKHECHGEYVVLPPDHPQGNRPMTAIEPEPDNKTALIGYMAVMISIAIENMRSNSFDESALEALKKAQAAYFSHVTTPKITKV